MTIEVPVYAPAPKTFLARSLKEGSALVGQDDSEGYVMVYYEGNVYGAVNMVTFADRAMFAYWRMRDRYPTVAQAFVPRNQLKRIATLYPEHRRIEVRNAKELMAVARWLGISVEEGLDGLHSELRCEGVSSHA